MNAYREEEAWLISALDVLSGQHHAPAALQRKERLYPFNSRLSGRQSHAGRFGEEKNLLHLQTNKARIEIVTFRGISDIDVTPACRRRSATSASVWGNACGLLQLTRQNEHFFLCSQNRSFQYEVCEVSVKLSDDIATQILTIFLLFMAVLIKPKTFQKWIPFRSSSGQYMNTCILRRPQK